MSTTLTESLFMIKLMWPHHIVEALSFENNKISLWTKDSVIAPSKELNGIGGIGVLTLLVKGGGRG